MKVLQNPLVVGALGVAALALVGWRVVLPLVLPRLGGGVVKQIVEDVGKKITAEARPEPSLPKTPMVEVAPRIEVAAISTNIAAWVAAPKRDPFQGRIRPRDERGAYPAAAELLTLSAIWRQSGANLVVINGQILSEGSGILDFKVASIESDQVWLQGPNGREVLGFKAMTPSGTNRTASASMNLESVNTKSQPPSHQAESPSSENLPVITNAERIP